MSDLTVDQIIRYKIGDSLHIHQTEIDIAKDEVARAILEFCNIGAMPESLKYVWANMTVDLIRYQYFARNPNAATTTATASEGTEPGSQPVEAIRIGDVSLTFAKASTSTTSTQGLIALNAHAPGLDELVMAYYDQLRAVRRIRR